MVRKPSTWSSTLCAPISELKDAVIKENKIYLHIMFRTKTRLSITVQGGSAAFTVNQHSEYSKTNNLKFDSERGYNYLTGNITDNGYFKLSKKQNVEVLKKHILSLMDYLLDSLDIRHSVDADNFEIICYTPQELLGEQ